MTEFECMSAVIVVSPDAIKHLAHLLPPIAWRAVTVIYAERASFYGVFQLPTRRPEVE